MFDHVSIKHNIKYTVGGGFFSFCACVRVSTFFNSPCFRNVPAEKKTVLGASWGQAQAAEKTMREEQQKYQEEQHMTPSAVGTLGSSAGSLSDNLIQLQELGGHNNLNHLNQAFYGSHIPICI